MIRDQAHRIPRTLGDEWDAMRAHPWRTAVSVLAGLFVLIVMVAAFVAAGLAGWGGMQ